MVQKQSVIDSNAKDSKFYINLSREGEFYYVGICYFNDGKMESLETYSFEDHDHEEKNDKYLEEFIINYFLPKDLQSNVNVVTGEDLSQFNQYVDNLTLIQAKTASDKSILDLIIKNLSRTDKEIDDIVLSTLKEEFHLDNIPKKIECYDISHFQGTQVVGSKTCLINGVVSKNYYRKYKLSVDKNDDFNNLKEVLTRRFNDKQDEFPDLVIIDGGTPQLRKIKQLFSDLNIQGVDLVALAKEKVTNSFQDAEIQKNEERIICENGDVVILKAGSLAYRLFTNIRNEAHRFAIKYHRELRKKVFIPR